LGDQREDLYAAGGFRRFGFVPCDACETVNLCTSRAHCLPKQPLHKTLDAGAVFKGGLTEGQQQMIDAIPVRSPAPAYGWVCPVCGAGNAPHAAYCLRCPT
jgi:hypothetical protein